MTHKFNWKSFGFGWAAASILIILLAFASLAHCQNAVLMPIPEQQFFSVNGTPVSNGFVYTYYTGTFSPAPTYTDYTGGTQNTQPVQLNAGGYPQTSGGAQIGIWLLPATQYRIVLQNASHVPIYQIDGVAGLVPSVTSGSISAVTATAPVFSSGGLAPNISVSVTGNGGKVATSNTIANNNNEVTFGTGNGNLMDTGASILNYAPLASPHFTGTPVLPANTIPFSVMTGGSAGQCAVNIGGVWQPGILRAATAGVHDPRTATSAASVSGNTTAAQPMQSYAFTSGALNSLGKSFRVTSMIQD